MCGFVALYQKKDQPIEVETIKKMTETIIHRGPDEEGIYVDKQVGFGFRRLSIIDIERGTQPLSNENKTLWIVFNGEIYNYQELQQWLKSKGHSFQTDSDTETILHLYEEVGFDCPKLLRGMFAFMIWDQEKQILFGARDHFGIKPVYWTETKDHFVFASEIKSLLELDGVKREVNPQSLYHYFTFQYVPDPETMFDGIKKIPPGHRFILKNHELSIEPYWKVEFQPDEDKPFSYFVEKTREVLEDSIQHHRISDVPRGAFLSSGVDSSSIVSLLRQYEEVQTFSVGFDLDGYNELDYARRTSTFLGTKHHEIQVDAERYLEMLPRLVWYQDEPVADPSAIALYFVAELASQYVTVVLSGEGADEFFAGYNIYREPQALRMFSYFPTQARKWIGQIASHLPQVKGRNYLIRGSKTVEERYFGNAFIFDESIKQNLLADSFDQKYSHPWEITHPIFNRVSEFDDVTKMQYLDIHTWLCGNILMKADKMSMANSLELRVPFIDVKVFEIASKIPTKYKITHSTTKYVLREAMKDIVPPEITYRKKLGFPVPIRYWLKKDFYKWAKELICDSRVDHWINKDFVLFMLNEHKEGRIDYSRQLWTVLIFMLWHQIYMERAFSFPSADHPQVKKHGFIQTEVADSVI
jgi:asparagine synthase (glutamine-hydrolysing)